MFLRQFVLLRPSRLSLFFCLSPANPLLKAVLEKLGQVEEGREEDDEDQADLGVLFRRGRDEKLLASGGKSLEAFSAHYSRKYDLCSRFSAFSLKFCCEFS